MESRIKGINYFAYFLIVFGAILRFLPHEANFAPISAIALFGGVYLNRKLAIVLPLAAMIVSDIFIGFDSFQSRTTVYGSFILIGFIGMWLKNHKTFVNVATSTVAGSLLFYLITNFAYFYPAGMYTHDLAGVVQSYINALPFLRGTLLGDIFYVAMMFGVYEFVRNWKEQPKTAVSESRN